MTIKKTFTTWSFLKHYWLTYTLFFITASFFLWQTITPYLAEIYFQKNVFLLSNNAISSSIQAIEKTVSLAPWEPRYLKQAAKTYEKSSLVAKTKKEKEDLLNQALISYQAAIKLDPNNPWYHAQKSYVYSLLIQLNPEKLKEFSILLIKHSKQAAVIDHQNPLFQLGHAQVLSSLDQVQNAIPFYKQALKLDPEMLDAAYQLSQIHTTLKNYPIALHYGLITYTQAPNYKLIRPKLAALYFLEKQLTLSKEFLLEHLKENPFHTPSLLQLGLIYIQKKEFSSAIPILSRAYKLRPYNSSIALHLSSAYNKHGDEKKANSLLTEFIQNNPEHTELKHIKNVRMAR